MANPKSEILYIIKTRGLQYDDRVRKECLSLSRLSRSVHILVIDDNNQFKEGLTDYGIHYTSLSLKTRKIFSQANGLLIKTVEMYILCLRHIFKYRPKKIWVHNIEMMGLIPFLAVLRKMGKIEKIIWDQHELLPENLLNIKIYNKCIKKLFISCDSIIMANGERKKYLLDKIKGHFNDKCYILHNYPDKHFSDLPKKGLPLDISKWLQGEPYILAQGGASPKRYIEEIIDAVLQIRYVKLVVVGSFESQLLERKRAEYGELFDKEVFFTGLIPQMQVAVFIDHALASIVLYNSGDMNSFYCAPNRMYQAVIRGKPVITGCNPPMSNFVNTYNVGIALLSDGRDVKDILSGMKLLFHKVSGKEISEIDKSLILWENQDEIIYAIIR